MQSVAPECVATCPRARRIAIAPCATICGPFISERARTPHSASAKPCVASHRHAPPASNAARAPPPAAAASHDSGRSNRADATALDLDRHGHLFPTRRDICWHAPRYHSLAGRRRAPSAVKLSTLRCGAPTRLGQSWRACLGSSAQAFVRVIHSYRRSAAPPPCLTVFRIYRHRSVRFHPPLIAAHRRFAFFSGQPVIKNAVSRSGPAPLKQKGVARRALRRYDT